MDRSEVEAGIRSAFAGVRLGSGTSLRQAEAIDRSIFGIESPHFARLPLEEVTNDWTLVPDEELRRDNMAHMDGEGLRYYLPAYMLWLLDHYDGAWGPSAEPGADMAAIGTISAIAPSGQFAGFRRRMYEDWFSDEQRQAIAAYVEALPDLVCLDREDEALVRRSLERFWPSVLTSEAPEETPSRRSSRRRSVRRTK